MGAEARTVRQCACQDSLQSLIMALPGSSSQDQLTLPPPCSVSDEHLQVPSQSSTLCRCPAPASDPGSKSRSGLRSGGGGGGGCAPSGDHASRRKKVGRLSSWNSRGRAEAGAPSSAAFSFPAPCQGCCVTRCC